MRKLFLTGFSLLILIFWGSTLKSQQSDDSFDTVRFVRDNNQLFRYSVSGDAVKEISFPHSQFEVAENVHFPIGGNLGRGALALLTGIEISSSKETLWLLAGTIQTDQSERIWETSIYCPGELEKTTNRVKNEDGTRSTEVSYERTLCWDKGALGLIKAGADTIGMFSVLVEPRNNEQISKWFSIAYKGKTSHKKSMLQAKREFAFAGDFRGKEFAIIFNSEEDQIYFFEEDQLLGTYRPERFQVFVRKSKVEHPLLRMRKNLEDQQRKDLCCLAMFSQWFRNSFDPPVLLREQ